MEKKKVCIVGGGAAGMIAAIMAGRKQATPKGFEAGFHF